MGLKVLNPLVKTITKTKLPYVAPKLEVRAFSSFGQKAELLAGEIAVKEAPVLKTPITKKEILNMKPSEFKKLLESRTDIAESFRVPVGTSKHALIYTPEQLSLFDTVNNSLLLKNVAQNERVKFLTKIMGLCPENAGYAQKVLPKLINKGYSLELLSNINITESNYKFIETVLRKQNTFETKISAIIEAQTNNRIAEKLKWRGNESLAQTEIQEITQEFQSKKEKYMQDLIRFVCSEVDSKNVKYIDEWIQYVNKMPINPSSSGIGNINVAIFRYWNKDTLKILEEFIDINARNKYELLEVIKRRGHKHRNYYDL